MKKLLGISAFLGIFFLLVIENATAASLYIDPPRSELHRGDAVRLDVRLDVDEETGECVNAVDAVITYTDTVVPVDVAIGDSIFSVWVEQPTIDKANNTITFAGGMPNGYCGRVTGDPRLTNRIASLIFRAPGFTIGGSESDDTKARVEFSEQTAIYLNDGFGTRVVPRLFGAELNLSKNAGPTGIVDEWRSIVNDDTVPPEKFSIFLQKGELEFAGEYYITFNTTDKQTGVDLYQVMEQPLEQWGTFTWGRADAPWITARSPYVLKDQSLNSVIRVRAIDKAGNEYIASLLPDESLRTRSPERSMTIVISVVIALILLGCFAVIVTYIRQRRKKRQGTENDSQIEANATHNESQSNDS